MLTPYSLDVARASPFPSRPVLQLPEPVPTATHLIQPPQAQLSSIKFLPLKLTPVTSALWLAATNSFNPMRNGPVSRPTLDICGTRLGIK